MQSDKWIEDHFPSQSHSAHALGLINIYWNMCEQWLFWVFVGVSKIPPVKLKIMLHGLGDIAICERILSFLETESHNEPLKEAVKNALAVYEICRRNRNQLTHFDIVAPYASSGFTLTRKSKRINDSEKIPFSSSLEDLRRVADEIRSINYHLMALGGLMQEFGLSLHTPWPQKLPEPELLWKPRPPIRQKPQYPPESSQA